MEEVGVKHWVLEATGICWKPVWHALDFHELNRQIRHFFDERLARSLPCSLQ